MKNNLTHDFDDIFCMATKCLTLFHETRTVTGKKNSQHIGIFGRSKCNPIESMGYIEIIRIKDKFCLPPPRTLKNFRVYQNDDVSIHRYRSTGRTNLR